MVTVEMIRQFGNHQYKGERMEALRMRNALSEEGNNDCKNKYYYKTHTALRDV